MSAVQKQRTRSPRERAAALSQAVKSADRTYKVMLRGRYADLPVASVELELPVYRAGNGRLAVLESSYLHRHGLPANHFDTAQDSDEVQAVLHGFLSDLSESPEAPIKAELRRYAQQTEPLLVTADAVVLNGNRRLAAMRDLLAGDREQFHGFAAIDVAVLPEDAASADIEMIEAALQMAPDTKLAYGWIERRLKMRHQREVLGIGVPELVEGYRLQSASQINHELAELELAESYLRDFLAAPFDYERLIWAEQPFRELRSTVHALPEPRREIWQAIGFCLIRGAEADESLRPLRCYPFASPVPGYAPGMLLHRLGAELELWESRLDELCFTPPSASDLQRLLPELGRVDQAPAHTARIVAHFEGIRIEHDEHPNPQVVINQLAKVARLMTKMRPEDFSERQRNQLLKHMANIQALYAAESAAPGPPTPISRLIRNARARSSKALRRLGIVR